MVNTTAFAAEVDTTANAPMEGTTRTFDVDGYQITVVTKSVEDRAILRAEDWKSKNVRESVAVKSPSKTTLLTFDAVFSFNYSPKLMEVEVASVSYENVVQYDYFASVTSVGRGADTARYNIKWGTGDGWNGAKYAALIYTVTCNGTWSDKFEQWN